MASTIQTLLQSWKASMATFKRPYARYFLLESLKATMDVYRAFFRGAWWIVVLILLSITYKLGAVGVLHALLFFVALCAARSSIGLKNSSYFFEKIAHFFFAYWLITVLVMGGYRLLSPWLLQTGGQPLEQFVLINCSLFLTVAGLCLIDSGYWIQSMIQSPMRALRMLVNNYPAFLSIELLRYGASFLMLKAVSQVTTTTSEFWLGVIDLASWFAFVPLYVALISTLYIKRAYEQGKYY